IFSSNFTIYRRDRGSVGGGVLLAVSSAIPSCLLLVAPDVELVVNKLLLPKPIVVGCAYLPPSPSLSLIASLFNHLSNLHTSLILLGDFNVPDVNWSSLTSDTPSSDLNLLQLVDCATHTGGNILDLILANCPDNVTDICIDSKVRSDMSDHSIIWFLVQVSKSEIKQKARSFFQYNKASCDDIQAHFAYSVLPPISHDSIDLFWGSLKVTLCETRDLFVPIVTLPAKPSPVCLMYHAIPREWKCHRICPIPKKGDLSEVSNYRPISLLCIMSKIFEPIVIDKVISYIQPKLSVCQFGFLKHSSCLLQLLSSYSTVFEAVENKTPVDTVFFDFQKAFDSVPHQELLLKLWLIGIT
uniref:Reverse transcriptase domain-containing protein n=2 Tax=Amphimedon queenslandica TaxID=400682 RepID=A0A1X7TP26_AMPQE